MEKTSSHQTQNTFIKLLGFDDDAEVLVVVFALSRCLPRIILFHFLVPA